jgi:hypothetical protein
MSDSDNAESKNTKEKEENTERETEGRMEGKVQWLRRNEKNVNLYFPGGLE